MPFDNLAQLRAKIVAANPVFAGVDRIKPAEWKAFGKAGAVSDAPFVSPIANFYMTDPISRASLTMARCMAEISGADRGHGNRQAAE